MQFSSFEWEHVSLPRIVLLTVLSATSTLVFSSSSVALCLPLKPSFIRPKRWLTEGAKSDEYEGYSKVVPWMSPVSPLSWCLCLVEHCHAERGHYRLASWVLLVIFLLWSSSGSQCLPQSLLFLLLARN